MQIHLLYKEEAGPSPAEGIDVYHSNTIPGVPPWPGLVLDWVQHSKMTLQSDEHQIVTRGIHKHPEQVLRMPRSK